VASIPPAPVAEDPTRMRLPSERGALTIGGCDHARATRRDKGAVARRRAVSVTVPGE
jgi:hypothetical protein